MKPITNCSHSHIKLNEHHCCHVHNHWYPFLLSNNAPIHADVHERCEMSGTYKCIRHIRQFVFKQLTLLNYTTAE